MKQGGTNSLHLAQWCLVKLILHAEGYWCTQHENSGCCVFSKRMMGWRQGERFLTKGEMSSQVEAAFLLLGKEVWDTRGTYPLLRHPGEDTQNIVLAPHEHKRRDS